MMRRAGLAFATALVIGLSPARAQDAAGHKGWPGAAQLFVGTCYQPVDRTPDQIRRDIARMRQAGFTVVRIGDLSWDAFEPEEGRFDFSRFDFVMDQMQANGLKVILDIPGLPAPLWLHRKYPGVDVVTQNGVRLHPAERYMEDISDPDYRRHAVALAEAITRHYARHPALLAIGFDNEIGNGFMSYSEADRGRFVDWLKRKYGSLEALNQAWATQRWSRRLSSWDEVELPYGEGPGPVERYLDLHRFWSDVTVQVLDELEAVRERNAADKPAISNLWDSAPRKGFDYLATYRQYVSYGAMGFYPAEPISASFEALMMKGGLATPIWFNEFTAGGGGYYGTPGRSRMWAYVGLLNGAQAALAWTFNSHLGGEEQALFGLIDHDDSPSWKLAEFATIASEFKRLQSLGFPRDPKPRIAVAYSFESRLASSPPGPSSTLRQYVTTPYLEQAHNAFAPLFQDNLDVAVINVGHEDLARYKLVVVPGDLVMDRASADHLRAFVQSGGAVVMTAFSAKLDETGQWFDTPLPGRLSDVFGLKTNAFYTAKEPLTAEFGGRAVDTGANFYEVLEPSTAEVIARLSLPGAPPAITVNRYGKGRAIYVATPATRPLMAALYRSLYPDLGLQPGPQTPEGVYARVVEGRTLYVNTTEAAKAVPIERGGRDVLSGRTVTGTLQLEPYGAALVEGSP